MLIWLFPAGIYLCFQELKDEHVFIIIYSVLCSYFAGVMVRLMLTLTQSFVLLQQLPYLNCLMSIWTLLICSLRKLESMMMTLVTNPRAQPKIKFQISNCWIIVKSFGFTDIYILPFLLCFTLYLGNIECLFITISCFSIQKPRWLTTYH